MKLFVGFLQALHQIRSQVDASTDSLLAWEVDLEYYVRVLCVYIVHAMDQCLIHVEDKELLLRTVNGRRQINKLVSELVLSDNREVVTDEVKGLERVFKVLPV